MAARSNNTENGVLSCQDRIRDDIDYIISVLWAPEPVRRSGASEIYATGQGVLVMITNRSGSGSNMADRRDYRYLCLGSHDSM